MQEEERNRIITWLLIIAMSAIFIVLTLHLTGVVKFAAVEPRVLYPILSSVCCKASQFADWDPAYPPPITNYDQQYVCPVSTTQCRVKSPQLTCPPADIWHPLGYKEIWIITVYDADGSVQGFSNIPLHHPPPPPDGKQLKPYGTVQYIGACVDYLAVLHPGSVYSGISPASGNMVIDVAATQLWRDPAIGGEYSIPNTQQCIRNQEAYNYAQQLPKKEYMPMLERAKQTLQFLGIYMDAPQATLGDLIDKTQLTPGECYLAVDMWLDLPYFGNVNPLGQYNNQDVICSYSHGIIKIDEIETYENVRYSLPTERLPQPDKFCCDHEYCRRTYGTDYNCVNYQCKSEVGFCNSDLDCQPMGGELIDTNCYREGNQFFTWYSTCDLNTHTCTPANKKEVKCCPSYCATLGQWCDFDRGCQSPIPKQPCPAGKCCNVPPLSTNEMVSPYYTQSCYGTLQCCPTNDAYQGVCKVECDAPEVCAWWAIDCHIANLLKDFQIPLITEESLIGTAVVAVIGVLLGFIGFGPIGAIGGFIGGAIIGYVGTSFLVILKPFIALFAFFLGAVYAYDFIQSRIDDKNHRLIIALVLGGIAGYITFISYWMCVVILLFYFGLKIVWGLSPQEKIAMGLEKYIK